MDTAAPPTSSPTTYVIREIYESENSTEAFMLQLERALLAKYNYIIIEPKRLAEETGRWIMLGNILTRLSAVSGLASLTISMFAPSRLYISAPLAGVALIARGFYDISWNFDPCSQYQVERSSQSLDIQLKESVAKSESIRILVYKDNTLLNCTYRTVAVAAVVLCGIQLYRSLK